MKTIVIHAVLLFACVCLSNEERSKKVSCPRGCTCREQDEGFITGCINQDFTEIPKEIATNTLDLYLQRNSIPEIGANAFANQPLLRTLVLTDSGIHNLHSSAFSGLEDLTSLDLRNNKIKILRSYIFSGLKNLARVILDRNRIRIIESYAFAGAGTLYDGISLSLKKNTRLHEIQHHAFQGANVEELYIHNSSLTNSSVESLRDLKGSLKVLFLEHNKLPLDIPPNLFSGFKIQVLILTNNGITDVSFLEFVTAGDISLSFNPIGIVDFSQYPTLSHVRTLQLMNTSMKTILSRNFEGMNQLSELQISRNEMTTLPEEAKSLFSRLQDISLGDNNIHCNCEILWFKDWVKNSNIRIRGADCTTPFQTEIRNADESMFSCSGPSIVTVSKESEEGQAVLVCISDGDPPSNLTWITPMGDSVVYQPKNKHTKNIARLKIHNDNKNGNYTCKAENLKGHKTASIKIDVYEAIAMARSQFNGCSSNKNYLHSIFMVILSATFFYTCIST